MAGSYLEQFVESIQSLPCDLARNLRLIRCLDTRVQDFVVSAENLSNKYVKDANQLTSTEKNDFYQNIMDYMNKAQHLTDEKKELAHQIYNIVDKHIRRLDNELAKFDIELDNNGYNDDSQTNHSSHHNSTNGKDHSDHNSHQTNSSSSNTHHTPSNRKNKRSKSSASHSTSTPLPSTTSTSLATSSSATTASVTSTSAKETSSSLKQSSAQKNDNSDSDNVKKRPASNNVEQTNGITNGIANNNSSMAKGKLVTSNGIMDMEVDPNEPLYCHCHQVSYGEMVGCDDPDCQIEWFHFSCVGLTSKPKGKWYCQNCQEKRKK